MHPSCRPSRRRTGFTLVELLVVIAIIGILIALLLPAIQAAREAARRTTCTNNLKQFGLALQNYTDINGRFPIRYYEWNGNPNGGRGGQFLRLLPFIEQKQVYDRFNFMFNIDGGGPGAYNTGNPAQPWPQGALIKGFYCPSNYGVPQINNSGTPSVNDPNCAAETDYAFSMGTGNENSGNNNALVNAWVPPSPYGVGPGVGLSYFGDNTNNDCSSWETVPGGRGDHTNGPFSRGCWAASIADISDGTSNTIAMSELPRQCGGTWSWNGWYSFDGPWTMTRSPINFPTCMNERDITGFLMTWNNGGQFWQEWGLQDGAKSKHPGGAQMLFCDGSVHFLMETINYETYQRLGSRRDARQVNNNDY